MERVTIGGAQVGDWEGIGMENEGWMVISRR